ncbi:MAG: efflux RND transporter periplasmic adaptor subunit [Sideroxydans sp.]|nr:efflux RND transporter periplasmic adaptor subunit [Sideroxydans sp.]
MNSKQKKISITLVLLASLSACGKAPTQQAEKAELPAMTIVVGDQGGGQSNVYSGEIRARHEAVLAFRTSGKLIARAADVGEKVKAGQVLAKLDGADAGLQEGAASAQLKLAEDELKRFRELRDKGFVSQSALDAKEASFKAASAQAGLAHNQAAYTSLTSDHAGVVAATMVEVGQVVSAGQPVLRVAQDGEREVAIAIPESRFSSVKVGTTAQIEISDAEGELQTIEGRVREVSPAADPASRTYAARISFKASADQAALGMTARVRISNSKGSAKRAGTYRIPLTALFQEANKAAVWVVAEDHSVSLRQVEILSYRDDGVLISGGVVAGDRIVSAGVHKLAAGDKVKSIDMVKAP